MLLNKNALRRGAIALALPLLVAACTATPSPDPTPSSTPKPTPSVTSLSPAEQDLANARLAVVKLWEVVDRLTNDPQASLQDLDAVAMGSALTMFQQNLGKYRAAQWMGTGASVVEDLEAKASGMDSAGRSTWTVTACVDGSGTTLKDQSGKSVQGPPYRIRHRSTVVQRDSALYVSEDEAVGTC